MAHPPASRRTPITAGAEWDAVSNSCWRCHRASGIAGVERVLAAVNSDGVLTLPES